MVHVGFDPSSINYESFFEQSGSGSYFEGLPLYQQRGHGYLALSQGSMVKDWAIYLEAFGVL
jgi:hypothetical protein